MVPADRLELPSLTPSVLCQALFDVGAAESSAQRLPQEVRDTVFGFLDKSTVLRWRTVSKAVNSGLMGSRRQEFNGKRGNLGQRHTMQQMLQRQEAARAAARGGEITQKFLQIDCDPEAKQKMYFDTTSGERLLWTRSGQLVAVGPYDQDPVVEILPRGTLASDAGAGHGSGRHLYTTATVLGGIVDPTSGQRRLLTYEQDKGLRLWDCGKDGKASWCSLLFEPPLDPEITPAGQGCITLSEDGCGVLYEAESRMRAWRWRVQAGKQSEATSTYCDYESGGQRSFSVDGLVLSTDGVDLLLENAMAGTTTSLKGNGTVDAVLPFSPCGTLVGAVSSAMRYRGNDNYRMMRWASIYAVQRPQGSPVKLRYVSDFEIDYYSGSAFWGYNQQQGWSLAAGGYMQAGMRPDSLGPQRPRSDTDIWQAPTQYPESGRYLRRFERTQLGSDFNGANYELVDYQFDQWNSKYLLRRAADGVRARMKLHDMVAAYLAERQTHSLDTRWSQDGTMMLQMHSGFNRTTRFEMIQFKPTVPRETSLERFYRALKTTATQTAMCLHQPSALLDFLLIEPISIVFGLGTSLIAASWFVSAGHLLHAIALSAAFAVGGVAFAGIVVLFGKTYFSPRPWSPAEELSVP